MQRFVGNVYENGIQIRVQPGSQAKNRKHSDVNCNEMSPQINNTVLSWRHFALELFFRRGLKISCQSALSTASRQELIATFTANS